MAIHANVEISTKLLRTLHRIHRQRNDLQSRLDRGPRQVGASNEANKDAERVLNEAKETLKKARLASDEKQLQLKSREQRVIDVQTKLNTASSNREFNTLKEQIAADKQANDVLSDEILESFEHIEQLEQDVRDREAGLEQRNADHAKLVSQVEKQTETLKADLLRVEEQLRESESEIPESVLGDYQRITNSKGEEGLAPVDGQSCGGCYQTLSLQMIDHLRLSRFISCPACGSWMYLPEDNTLGE